jgi:hypothetical protein
MTQKWKNGREELNLSNKGEVTKTTPDPSRRKRGTIRSVPDPTKIYLVDQANTKKDIRFHHHLIMQG